VNLTSDEPGEATVKATAGGKVVATGRVTLTAAGAKRVVLRFTKKAKAKFGHVRKLELTVKARVVDAAGNAATKTIRLRLKR
jgi:ribosomal protein S11